MNLWLNDNVQNWFVGKISLPELYSVCNLICDTHNLINVLHMCVIHKKKKKTMIKVHCMDEDEDNGIFSPENCKGM